MTRAPGPAAARSPERRSGRSSRVKGVVSLAVVALLLGSAFLVSPLGSRAVSAPAGEAPRVGYTLRTPVASPSSGSSFLRAEAIDRSLAAMGVPANAVHLPDLGAADPGREGPVGPTYTSAPAPMGVADLGVKNVSGTISPYVLNASSVAGTANFTDAEAVYLDGNSPDTFDVQFNAVATNVTVGNDASEQYWAQSFASYSPSSGALSLGDNLWNFSNPSLYLSPRAIFAHGPNGTFDAPIVYFATGPTFVVAYPFTVSFYLNASLSGGRPAIFFNYSLTSASVRSQGSFDEVVFNPTLVAPSAPEFQVNGTGVDPAGLLNDVELVAVGDGGMDTTTFFAINATFSIAFWNASQPAYDALPSAYDAGADTGETSDGIDVTDTISGASPVAVLGTGPSFLGGLWNVSSEEGRRGFVLNLTPVNAFLLVNPGTVFNEGTAQWAPTMAAGAGNPVTFYVPNDGPVFLELLLSDYRAIGETIDPAANSTATLPAIALVRALNFGLYTPLIAWGNGELAAISPVSGNGSAAHPFVTYNNQLAPLAAFFAATNDYLFPVFPGLLFIGTNASVTLRPPSFETRYSPAQVTTLAEEGLPATNDLQIELWNVSNVTLEDGSAVSGWLPSTLSDEAAGSVILWNSSGNLVAHNQFDDEGTGLVLSGGSNNTVWGNSFLASPVPATDPASLQVAPGNTTGVLEAESGDLLYNNYFDLAAPAVTPTLDPTSCLVSCEPVTYTDRWNVTPEASTVNRTLLGVNLTGSIIGTSYQGGNYWSNYGSSADPYGKLPYTDSGRVTLGGDYDPLVPFSLYAVTFDEAGLAAGTVWGVTALGVSTTSNTSSLVIYLPNGSFLYTVLPPAGYAQPSGGTLVVNGTNSTVDLSFAPLVALLFVESGLTPGSVWNVTVVGTSPPSGAKVGSSDGANVLPFELTPGIYNYSVSAYGYAANPSNGTFTLTASAGFVAIAFSVVPVLLLSQSTLPAGTAWTVTIEQGLAFESYSSVSRVLGLSVFDLPTGAYEWFVTSPGYTAVPDQGFANPAVPVAKTIAFTVVNGTLVGTVTPESATLEIDGAVVALVNGTFDRSEAPATYSFLVTAYGYAPYRNNVSVESGFTTPVEISLESLPSAPAGFDGISDAGWIAIGLLAVLAAGALVLAARRGGRSPPPLSSPPGVVPPAPAAPAAVARAPWEEGPEDRTPDLPGGSR